MAIEHDAERGLTRYEWRRGFGFVVDGVSTRAGDPAGWCLDFDALRDSYDATIRGTARLHGRLVRNVDLTPVHPGRPRVRLAVDAEHLLPLQVDTYGADGSLYRSTAFRKITFGPCTVAGDDALRFGNWRGASVAPERLAEAAGFAVLRPDYVPPGFRLADCRLIEWIGTDVRMVYTDGLTAFELCQSRVLTPARMEMELARRLGPARAEREVDRHLEQRYQGLALAGESGEGTVARRCDRGSHVSYELRTSDLDVRLTARSDLPGAELLSVLRSLRPR
jgi:negative regulator of sigma E activity